MKCGAVGEWRRYEKVVREVTNEEVLELSNNILHRKTNWIGHILREIAFFMMPLKDR